MCLWNLTFNFAADPRYTKCANIIDEVLLILVETRLNFTREYRVELYNDGVNASKIRRLPSTVDITLFNAETIGELCLITSLAR